MSFDDTTPIVTRHFDVRLTLRGPRGGFGDELTLGFSQVIIPPLRLDGGPKRPAPVRPTLRDDVAGDAADAPAASSQHLVLRRGHTGSPELYDLWKAARDRERLQLREVTVLLLDSRLEPVTAWRFRGCHIVGLEYSPLDAIDVGVLMETLEVSFKDVEQFAVGD